MREIARYRQLDQTQITQTLRRLLGTVNEIETLATGLSGKIWQKITLLERATRAEAGVRS